MPDRPTGAETGPESDTAPGTVAVLKALADPVRLQILDHLAAHPCGVTELSRSLTITRQGTAKHLTVLRGAGLVREDDGEGDGPAGGAYRVVPAEVDATARVLAAAADRWTTQLALIRTAAEGKDVPAGTLLPEERD